MSTCISAVTMPDPGAVSARATEILSLIQADPDFGRLEESTALYPDCWATYTGYPIICEWDLSKDAAPLFTEALRVLALKSAVFELTGGDEAAAELIVSAPVDEMVHAVLAQFTLINKIADRAGVTLVHMTDRERFGWQPGDYTDRCYRAAWGEPNSRYWIDSAETKRRLGILGKRYESIGIGRLGRTHDLDFATA